MTGAPAPLEPGLGGVTRPSGRRRNPESDSAEAIAGKAQARCEAAAAEDRAIDAMIKHSIKLHGA